ncbi:arginase family protein [Bacteroidota bacterium]
MKKQIIIVIFLNLIWIDMANSQGYINNEGKIDIAIVRNRTEGPRVMAESGLKEILIELGCNVKKLSTVKLSPAEDRQYGDWNKEALESKHIGDLIAENNKNEFFTIGLLDNCTDLLGMLAGLQNMKPQKDQSQKDFRSLQNSGLAGNKPLRIGLVWIDAHADFNTPETSLSGMLGGMPVAIASGMCLTRLRLKTGLDPALPSKYVVMSCLRDVDPLEQELIDRSQIEMISVQDVRNQSDNINFQIERLSKLTDIIYIHIDMDVLDPEEVAGHPLTAPDGPGSIELAAALKTMFTYEKVAALGIASLPHGENDKDNLSLKAAYRLIVGAINGVKARRKN